MPIDFGPSAPVLSIRVKPEAEALARNAVAGANLTVRHQIHFARGKNTDTVERAAVPNHLEEARVVARGRQNPGAAGEFFFGPST